MLRPIPSRILRSTVTVKACTGLDRYQNQTYEETAVSHVHIQPTVEIRRTRDNTDMTLRSMLFVDRRRSAPQLDWEALFTSAHAFGGDVQVIAGNTEYTVVSVDALRDDTDRLHHWEIGLV